jgi:pimeloyl-ACP methyl ester carboxylesterase
MRCFKGRAGRCMAQGSHAIAGPARALRRALGAWALCVGLSSCHALIHPEAPSADPLVEARALWRVLPGQTDPEFSAQIAMQCASLAYLAMSSGDGSAQREAEALGNRCTSKLLDVLLSREPQHWTSRTIVVGGTKLDIDFRGVSSALSGPVTLGRADAVAVPPVMGVRHSTKGFGIAMVATQPRCSDRPMCHLFPPEGIFRPLTAWVEPDMGGRPHLVMTDPFLHPVINVGGRDVALASDVTAPYAAVFDRAGELGRLAIWNLLGGTQLSVREGLYLLEDYDPNKTPIIMLHGLGRSPLIWARLTNMIFGSPDLRARYQVWHIVYPTSTPILLDRYWVQTFLDHGWSVLDPSGTAPARQNVVLIGHSLGGVISRLLTANSGEVVWNAVFDESIAALNGKPADIATVDSLFHFDAYPGVSKAIFLATPHQGSPVTNDFIGHLGLTLVRVRAPELDALVRVTDANRQHVSPALTADYQKEGLSSISTLRTEQPVSHAAQSLMPVAGVRYYTFAGNLPGAQPPGDGIVPLKSAILPGAESTTIVKDGHQLYLNDEVLAKIVAILRQH